MACRVELKMPPTTTSTAACSTSLAATASATLSSVALSSMNNSTGRPRRPPPLLMSSITILATLTLAMPMKESGPVWSVMTPTRAGRLLALVMSRPPSRLVGAEQQRGLGLGQVAGFLEDRRDVRVGDELRPSRLVPVEEHPDPVLLGWITEHGRTLGAVERALLGALCAEHVEESVELLDGRGCQDHGCFPSISMVLLRSCSGDGVLAVESVTRFVMCDSALELRLDARDFHLVVLVVGERSDCTFDDVTHGRD